MGRVLHRERAAGSDARLLAFLDTLERELSYDCMVVWGKRTPAEQLALYAQGRTVPGPNVRPGHPLGDVVTNAGNPQVAPHCHAGALDVVPLLDDGHIHWDAHDPRFPEYMARQAEIGALALREGLGWGGTWPHFKDWDHVEVSDWARLPLAS